MFRFKHLTQPDYYIEFDYMFFIGHTTQVCLFLKHKANQYLRDHNNTEPLDIAIKQANANIVTL